jgi:hypothetical protein
MSSLNANSVEKINNAIGICKLLLELASTVPLTNLQHDQWRHDVGHILSACSDWLKNCTRHDIIAVGLNQMTAALDETTMDKTDLIATNAIRAAGENLARQSVHAVEDANKHIALSKQLLDEATGDIGQCSELLMTIAAAARTTIHATDFCLRHPRWQFILNGIDAALFLETGHARKKDKRTLDKAKMKLLKSRQNATESEAVKQKSELDLLQALDIRSDNITAAVNAHKLAHEKQVTKCNAHLTRQHEMMRDGAFNIPIERRKCAVCNSTSTLKCCGRCKQVYYCNPTHQHQDWQNHKSVCTRPTKAKKKSS